MKGEFLLLDTKPSWVTVHSLSGSMIVISASNPVLIAPFIRQAHDACRGGGHSINHFGQVNDSRFNQFCYRQTQGCLQTDQSKWRAVKSHFFIFLGMRRVVGHDAVNGPVGNGLL